MRPLRAATLGTLLLAAMAAGSVALGTPLPDALSSVGIAGGAALLVGVAGSGLLRLLMGASFRAQVSAAVLVVVCVVAVGAVAAANARLISPQDARAVAMIVVAAGLAGAVTTLMLAEKVRQASRQLGQAARTVGSGDSPAATALAIPELEEVKAELARASVRLEQAREREQAQERARRELFSWVSHDLRAPLARILAASEALEDGLAHGQGVVERFARTIRLETGRLGTLVDDLFQLSLIEAGALRLSMESVGLDDLVSEVLAGIGPAAAAKGVRITSDVRGPLPPVWIAPDAVARALGNLLDNALRETPADGTVHVEIAAGRDAVSVAVRDECGGIPDDRRSELLTGPRPAAAGSSTRAGLGLAIAKGLLAAHDATLTVRNEASGCRFETRIPIPLEHTRRS